MNKLLIEIHVPSIGRTFDVFIPSNARVFELLPLITTALIQLSDGMFIPNDVVLCDGFTGGICDHNKSVNEMQLKNGSRLLLI